MFKFKIGSKGRQFGDTYFPCPLCLGQSVYTEEGGRCWDCNAVFTVTLASGKMEQPETRTEYLPWALLGLGAVLLIVLLRKPGP